MSQPGVVQRPQNPGLRWLSGLSRPQRRLLGLLSEHGPLHRAELARRLGVSRARLTGLSGELLREGLLEELDDEDPVLQPYRASDGRAGPALAVAASRGLVAGVQTTERCTRVVVTTLSGLTVADMREAHSPAGLGTPEERAEIAAGLLDRAVPERRAQVRMLGVGAFGQVNTSTGVVEEHRNAAWNGQDVGGAYSSRFDLPVVVDNNAQLEALAESKWGAGQEADPVLYVHAGFGLGASLVIAGEPYGGARGGAGELGHVSIDIAGPLCVCGNRGCVSLSASGAAVRESLSSHWGADVELEELLAAARSGDKETSNAFLEAARILGMVVAGVANLLQPQTVVVGGDMVRAGPRFVERLETEFHDHTLGAKGDVAVVAATMGEDGRGGALAAALLARRAMIRNGAGK